MARTMEMVAKLSDVLGGEGGGWTTKGGGKGGKGWTNDKEKNAPTKKRFCPWDTCKAAQNKQSTFGSAPACFCCKRLFSSQPPIERLVAWAYQEKLKGNQANPGTTQPKGKGSAKGGKSKGKGFDKNSNQNTDKEAASDLTADQLAEIRKTRLAALRTSKDAKEDDKDQPTPKKEDISILEEVTAAWTMEGAEGSEKALRLDQQLAQDLEEWDLQPLFETMKHDHLPASSVLKAADVVVAGILSESKPCAGALAAGKLEAELAALRHTLVHYEAEGLEELKAETQLKIKSTAERLEKSKAPTAELQRKDVVTLKAQFIKDAQARTETALAGKQKAADRIATRTSLIQKTISMYQQLANALVDRDLAIEAAHTTKSSDVEVRDTLVCSLSDKKIEELAAKEAATKGAAAAALTTAAAFVGYATGSSSPAATAALVTGTDADPELKKALQELETFKTQQTELMQKIQDLQAAAGTASSNPTARDNDPIHDVWLECEIDKSLIPPPKSDLAPSDQTQVTRLTSFFQAVPWAAQLPTLTFHVLGAHPSMAHSLVGDQMWKDVWGEKSSRVTTEHMVPYCILNVLKLAVEQRQEVPNNESLEEGRNRWAEAKRAAAARRARGSPY